VAGANAHALTLEETNLTDLGFNSISISQPSTTVCETLAFTPFSGYDDEGNDTVLHLHTTFLPASESDANVSVYLNGQITPFMVWYPVDIHPDSQFASVIIPSSQQTNPQTTLQICATSSPSSDTLNVDEATIGLYQQARFDEEGAFATIIAGENPVLGEEIPIQVVLTNHGGESVFVNVDYRKYELEYVPLLKGETGFQTNILPGQTKIITYKIKPLRAVSILLPPAVLTYTNIFGEKIIQDSERAFLLVAAPEFNVKGAFLVPQNRVQVNEPMDVDWVVQNEGIAPISGIDATFFVRPEGLISPASTSMESLSPSDAKSQPFTVSFTKPGMYELGCTLTSKDDPSLTTSCQSVMIEVVEDNTGITLLFSLLLLLIAVSVYAYIYILPNAPKKEEPPKRGRFHSK
jgi:hypothetical protein